MTTQEPQPTWAASEEVVTPPAPKKSKTGIIIVAIVCATIAVLAIAGAASKGSKTTVDTATGYDSSDDDELLTEENIITIAQHEWDGMTLDDQSSVCTGIELLGLDAMTEGAADSQGLSYDDPIVLAWRKVVSRECL